jgi:tRNA-2-methylthio-N6-dimethylallyladenosine synthase
MRRLQEIIDVQRIHSAKRNEMWVGKKVQVLIEGDSKKSKLHHFGKIDSNKVVVFPKRNEVKGDYVFVHLTHCTSGTLLGELC